LVLVRVGNHAEVSEVTSYLAAVVDRVGIRAPVQTIAAFGEPATEILETARRFDADEVVMATHGRTGPAHLLHGSVAEAVLGHSPYLFSWCMHVQVKLQRRSSIHVLLESWCPSMAQPLLRPRCLWH
jgi:hypothetical protein